MRDISAEQSAAVDQIYDRWGIEVAFWLATDGYTEVHINGSAVLAARTTPEAIRKAEKLVAEQVALSHKTSPDGDAQDRCVGFR